ncbi:APC family permease [Morganella psychrotolerans]|uniref:APC family permease n=1 Tax=Morganella psychrotolerans TaxID=368603 RepID=UPI0039B00B02
MKSSSSEKSLTLLQVVALGIGAMVGAGIFALLGQTALIMQSATWLAFSCGGVIALFAGYAYARLAARYPSQGGIIDFFRLSLPSVATIALSLLYLVTLILTIAMVARAFGAYAVQLFHQGSGHPLLPEMYTAFVIIAIGLLNIVSSHAVGKIEVLLVGIKLTIIIVLIITGLFTMDAGKLEIHTFSGDALFSAVGLTFFAYAGFGMMANASDKVAEPERVMPKAFMIAILFTIVLYISLSLVLLGNLSPAVLARYADTAVAQVAYPIFGQTGFTIVAIGALLATASAINATCFSAFNILDSMSRSGLLPHTWGNVVCGQGTRSNILMILITLVFALMLNLSDLANVASFTFLLCYLMVLVVAWRLSRIIRASKIIIGLGIIVILAVLAGFVVTLFSQGIIAVSIISGALIVCLAIGYQRRRSLASE